MPLIHCNFFSEALRMSTAMDVILPLSAWKGGPAEPRPGPTLYLLHGLSDDQTIWQRRTSIERYVEGTNLAVVMPAVQRSYYTDMAAGLKYWTFISEEVPYAARSLFHLSAARADNFVAGLSMGGYGAFKLALTYPGRYAAAASLSGALDKARSVLAGDAQDQQESQTIFGDLASLKDGPNDLFHLAKTAANSHERLPRLYQWCGKQDSLYEANQRFRKHTQGLGLDLRFTDGPGGHEWKCWDEQIQRVLEWIKT